MSKFSQHDTIILLSQAEESIPGQLFGHQSLRFTVLRSCIVKLLTVEIMYATEVSS